MIVVALVGWPFRTAYGSTINMVQLRDGGTHEMFVNFSNPADRYQWWGTTDGLVLGFVVDTASGWWALVGGYESIMFLEGWGGNPTGMWDAGGGWGSVMVWGSDQGPRQQEILPQTKGLGLAMTKEPINTINGAVIHDEVDFEIPFPQFPFSFSRRYNSQLPYVGTLGAHWTHAYNWFLSATNAIEWGITNSYQIMQTGEGERLWFMQSVSNTFASPYGTIWTLAQASNGVYTSLSPEGTTYSFDTNGVLSAITRGFGQSLAFTYTNTYPNQRLASVTHWNQQGLQFQYDVSNRLVGITTPSTNLSVSYNYNGDGDLVNAVTHAGPNLSSNAYSYVCMTGGWHCLTQIVNAVGTRFAYGYSTNVPAQGGPWGTAMTMTNDWYAHEVAHSTNTPDQTAVTYHRGNTNLTFNYQFNPSKQRINTITGPNGNNDLTVFTYDALGYLLGMTVSNNLLGIISSTVLTRDANHNITSLAMGYCAVPANMYSYTWNTNWDTLASVTDPEGHLAEWDYTNDLVRTERLYPATNQPVETHYSYTSNGVLAFVTNANNHWVSYQSDAYGNPTQTISQAGTTNWMTWDVLSHLKEIRLPSHQNDTNDPPNMIPRVISFNPNELGWVSQITYPDSACETFAFDAIGNVTNHVDVAGRTTAYTWLPTRKRASTTRYLTSGGSNQAVTIGLAYDQQMNVVNVKDELGRGVETYQLDLQDRPTSVTNVENQVMTLSWGLKNMVNQIVRFDGSTNTFVYDDGQRVKQITYPDDTLSFTYYKNGLPNTASNRWGTITNTYDGANRLTAQTQPGPSGNVAYGYYSAGQVSNVVSVAGTNAYSLDAGERIQTFKVSTPGRQDSLAYAYDPVNGMMTGVSYSNGINCSYSYDLMDRLTGISWCDASNRVLMSRTYTYTPAGLISNITYETGAKASYTYDSLDRLTREKHTDYYGQVISDQKYDYDLAGNRTQKTVLDANGNNLMTVNYSLFAGNRLGSWMVAETNLAAQFSVLGYSSDPIGTNDRFGYLWVSNSASAMMKPYVEGTNFFAFDLTVGMGTQYVYAAIRDVAGNTTYVTNRFYPTTLTNGTYNYNAAGCLTNFQYSGKDYVHNVGLTWNGQYQLAAASTNGVAAEQYGYDAAGRRIFIVQGGTTNWMVYDGNQVVAEVDGSGNLKKAYVNGTGIDNLISMTVFGSSTNTYYYLKDHLGSVLALTDGNGVIVESYRYDAWGRVLGVYDASGSQIDESAVGNRILWQGREYSWKTGLYYFRERWYDPITGRFLSNDPIGISGGLNQYVFCGNNPVNFVDPFGLCEESSGLNWVQGGLDAVGVFDPFGIADGLNALIYLGRGQYGNASISAIGMIPYIGDIGKAGKYGVAAVNVTSRARSVERALETGEIFVGKGYKEVAPGVYRSADGARQFRMTGRDLAPTHGDIGPHVHYQKIDPITGQEMKNIHTPLLNP